MLTPRPLEHLQVVLGELDAGGSTGDEPYTHGDSEELLVVLAGDRLAPARNTRCSSSRRATPSTTGAPRRIASTNVGGEVAEVMWIISPPSSGRAGAGAWAWPDVELVGVTKRFGGTAAVDGIDLEVHPGEFLSLLGPSGCGKTTTLRLIAGFEQPDEGEVRIGGRDVSRVPPYKRDVNTVFQSYALFPHLTVLDNVAYGLKQRGLGRAERRTRAPRCSSSCSCRGSARKPRQLSGGQQQRVALARALVMKPRVLLLDEPLGALDLKVRKELQIELKRIQEEIGITFVYVTHDQEEALACPTAWS